MQIQEILIIKNAHENYGISTEDINQISRVPSLMPLPYRPSGTRGLCSVGGQVISMVDMNLLLGMDEVDIDASKSRVVSLNNELASNALLVSDVYNTVDIDENNIEYLDKKDDAIIAIYKYEDLLVQILSLEELFKKMSKLELESKEIKNGKPKEKIVKEEDSTRFLIFSMSNEQYALEIDYLQEIILADIKYTEITGTRDEVLGLITLRNELLVVIDLRVYYGFKPNNSDKNRILIVSYDGKKVGVCVDSIVDIRSFKKKDIEYMKDAFSDNKIAGVIHNDEILISFFDNEVITRIFNENETYIDSESDTQNEEIVEDFAMEAIVFKLAGKEYAFNVDHVNEIIDVVPATSVAFSDDTIDGIINIRGQIVTTVSLFNKLGIEQKVNEDSKMIICNINRHMIGFGVDSVSDILNIKESELKVENDSYFESIFHLDGGKRLVLSLNLDKVLHEEHNNV